MRSRTLLYLAALMATMATSGARDTVVLPLTAGSLALRYPEARNLNAVPPLAVAGGIYFNAFDATNGYEWWFSDGSPAGTRMVCEQGEGGRIFAHYGFYDSGIIREGSLFTVRSSSTWSEHLRMDGSTAASVRVLPPPGPANSFAVSILGANAGGAFYDYITFLPDGEYRNEIAYRADSGNSIQPIIEWDSEEDEAFVTTTGRLFVSKELTQGEGVWTSDGTTAGTIQLPVPWTERSYGFVQAGSYVFFTSYRFEFNPGSGSYQFIDRIWRSDGTVAGTTSIHEVNPGAGYGLEPLFPVGSQVWFLLPAGPSGVAPLDFQLWRTSGAAGTPVLVKTLTPSPLAGDGFAFLGVIGGQVLLHENSSSPALWRSDGTAAGTITVTSLPGYPVSGSSIPYNGWIYCHVPGSGIVRTNGTTAQTFFPEPFYSPAVANGYLFFESQGDYTQYTTSPVSHWRTDGTVAGTIKLVDHGLRVAPVIQSLQVSPESFAVASEDYSLSSPAPAKAWLCDGRPWSAGGTTELNTLSPEGGRLRLIVGKYQSSDGHLAFEDSPRGFLSGTRLWKRTGAGYALIAPQQWQAAYWTSVIEGFFTSAEGSMPLGFDAELGQRYLVPGATEPDGILTTRNHARGTSVFVGRQGGRDYFTSIYHAPGGPEYALWSSDGTVAGSFRVIGDYDQYARFYAVGEHGIALTYEGRLSTSDGLTITPQTGVQFVDHPTVSGGLLYFAAGNVASGVELWKWVPGSAPVMVKDIVPGMGSSFPTQLRAAAGKLWFSADDGVHGYEPWTSDGTAAGTNLVSDLIPGVRGSEPAEFTEAGDYAVFAATGATAGRELWQSNGTTAGTRVSDSVPGTGSSQPTQLERWNDSVIHLSQPAGSSDPTINVFTPDPTAAWAAWADNAFGAAASAVVRSPHSDADKDGADNFAEYAFGTHPLNGSSRPALARAPAPPGCLAFSATARHDTGLQFSIECSSDLKTWTPWRFRRTSAGQWDSLTPGLTISGVSSGSDMSTLTLCIPAPAGPLRCFTRVTAQGS